MSHKIIYHASYHKVTQCPTSERPEFAFIGRSNVGKSSLINSLFDRKDLAYVSKQPGKTQSINYYQVDDDFFIVDLPGFGYAKHSRKQRRSWESMSKNYFLNRQNLACVFVLIDANIPLQVIDREFISWLGAHHIPYVMVFTKCDKSKPRQVKKNIEEIQEALLKEWEYLPPHFITSAVKGEGKDLVLDYLFNLADDSIEDERE